MARSGKSRKKIIVIIGIIVVILAVVIFMNIKKSKKANVDDTITTVEVKRGDIVSLLEASGTLEAIDQYEITSIIGGEIVADHFEEGDYVKEGQLLYEIDKSSIIKNIDKAENSLKNSQIALSSAYENVSDLQITTPADCVVTKVYIENGDEIGGNAKICDYIDNSNMTLTINFLASQASDIYPGNSAEVEIIGTSDVLYGTVSSVSSGSFTNAFGSPVSQVKISVSNAGGITETTKATAKIGGYACAEPGTFSNFKSGTITSKQSGTVTGFNVNVGDKLYKGQKLAQIYNKSVTDQYTKQQLSYNDAKLSLEDLKDSLEDYSLKATISGKVIKKTMKKGDKISAQSGSTSLAIIADLSAYKFTISVDEADIKKIKVGQEVSVTADALGKQAFTGAVNNVSIIGTSENGVTTYPVEILIENVDNTDLIPGLNVDAKIILGESKNCLIIPANAVSRGNKVKIAGNDEMVTVETGLNDGVNVEIKSGLKEDDKVEFKVIKSGGNNSNSMMGGGMGGAPMGGGNMGGGNMGGGNMRSGSMGSSSTRSGSMGGGAPHPTGNQR